MPIRRPTALRAVIALAGLAPIATAQADSQLFVVSPTYLPSYFALGAGTFPDYIGSDDYAYGVGPVARYSWGDQRYLSLEITYASLNLVDDRNWRFGPTGMYRFARDDVQDRVVRKLPEVDPSLDLGLFVAYEDVGEDPRDRWRLDASVGAGVVGGNEGYVLVGSFRRWLPVGRFAAIGTSLAATWGSGGYMDSYFSVGRKGAADSGLPEFEAGAGLRDVRITLGLVQPLSREWQVGVGALYSRLMDDAAGSPIVSERGSRDQFAVGVGVNRAF